MVARVNFQEILRDKLTNLFFFLSNGITIDETSRRKFCTIINLIIDRSMNHYESLSSSILFIIIWSWIEKMVQVI